MRLRWKLDSSLYLRDVVLQATGNSAAQVLAIAAMPWLTRLYTPSDFAVLNLFTQLMGGLAILMTVRFEYLVMPPPDQRESNSVLGLTFLLGAFHVLWLTPVLWFLPEHWAWLNSKGVIADWVWLAPLAAWAVSLAVGVQQAVQRRGDFRTSAQSEFVGRSAYVSCALLGALALPSVVGLISAGLANSIAKLAWLSRTGSDFKFAFLLTRVPIANSLRRMAISTSASSLISLVSGFAPMLYIAERYGAEALGQYGLVVSTLYLPSVLIGQAIGQVYYQRACGKNGDGQSFSDLLVMTGLNLAKIGLPLYATVAFIAPWAYPFVFGPAWGGAGEMARWLCIAAACGFLSTPFDRTSLVVGTWWYLSAWQTVRALLTVASLLIASIYALSLLNFILLLSLLSAFAYAIDFAASFLMATRLPLLATLPQRK